MRILLLLLLTGCAPRLRCREALADQGVIEVCTRSECRDDKGRFIACPAAWYPLGDHQ